MESKERKFGKPKLAKERMYDVQFIRRVEYQQTLIGKLEKETMVLLLFLFSPNFFRLFCLFFVNTFAIDILIVFITILPKMFRRTKCKLADIDNCGYELQTINKYLFLFKVQLTVLLFIRFAVFFFSDTEYSNNMPYFKYVTG